jgi:hypothetical protein
MNGWRIGGGNWMDEWTKDELMDERRLEMEDWMDG